MKTNTCLVVCHGFSYESSGYLIRIKRMLATLRKANLQPHVVWFVPLKQVTMGKGLASAHLHDVPATWLTVLPSFRNSWIADGIQYLQSWLVPLIAWWLRPAFVQAENTDAMQLCTRVQCPVVFDMHGDTIAEAHPDLHDEPHLAASPAAAIERRLLMHTDHLICASRNLETVLRHRHGGVPDTSVVPCAADLAPFFSQSTQRDAERLRLGVTGRLVLCYLGGLSSWQCIEQTLALVARLKQAVPEIYFLLLTPNDPLPYQEQLNQLGRAAADYAILSLRAHEVPTVLSAVDAGFLLRARSPINHVASPTKCGEYLAAGVPVICTQYAGDAAPMITETGAGLVLKTESPTDAEIETLVAFLRNVSAQRAEWRSRAMDAARRRCDWAVCENNLIHVYQQYRRGEDCAAAPVLAPVTPHN